MRKNLCHHQVYFWPFSRNSNSFCLRASVQRLTVDRYKWTSPSTSFRPKAWFWLVSQEEMTWWIRKTISVVRWPKLQEPAMAEIVIPQCSCRLQSWSRFSNQNSQWSLGIGSLSLSISLSICLSVYLAIYLSIDRSIDDRAGCLRLAAFQCRCEKKLQQIKIKLSGFGGARTLSGPRIENCFWYCMDHGFVIIVTSYHTILLWTNENRIWIRRKKLMKIRW